MSLIALVIVFALMGASVAAAATRLPRRGVGTGTPRIGIARRFDPEAATGLALTLALLVLVAGGIAVGVLAYLIRDAHGGTALDTSIADWGGRHTTGFQRDVLNVFTDLGRPGTISVLAAILAVEETLRTRSRWIAPFLLLVVAGNGIVTTSIKHLVDRVRPEIDPIAATLGPSFPSGHSSWSAAFFAAAALVLSRGRSRRVTVLLAGLAAGLAAAIGASRVLLGVHWLTDVLAGLCLGWAWFAVCAIAFGGRLLRFGATAEVAGGREGPEVSPRAPAGRPTARRP